MVTVHVCVYFCVSVCHLARVVFLDDADGSLAEHLGGVNPLVSRGNLLPLPQVQRAAGEVKGRDGAAAHVGVVLLAACQVALREELPTSKTVNFYE